MVAPINLWKFIPPILKTSDNKDTDTDSSNARSDENTATPRVGNLPIAGVGGTKPDTGYFGIGSTNTRAAPLGPQGDSAASAFSSDNITLPTSYLLNLNSDAGPSLPEPSVDVAAERLDEALADRDAVPSSLSHYYDGAVNTARDNLDSAIHTEIENGDSTLSPEEIGESIVDRFDPNTRLRAEVLQAVNRVAAQAEIDEQDTGPEPVRDSNRLDFLDSLPEMNGRRALEIIDENFDLVDAADDNGVVNGTAAKNDLERIANSDPGEYNEDLVSASQYLLDNPEFYAMMEVVREGDEIQVREGRQSEIDGRFTQEEVQVFLQGQDHMKVILANADDIDVSQSGGTPDGLLSRGDFEEITNKKDEDGNFVYSSELRESVQFMLDNDRFYELVDAAAIRGARPGISNTAGENNFNSPDGDVSSQDLYLSALQMQVYVDDPASAREFLLNADPDILDNFNVSDENSIPDEGLRATTAAAMRDVESMDDVVELILALPETNLGFRNEMITAVYADLGVEIDEFLGAESGANWAIWAVPASTKVGEVIRNEQIIEFGPLNNGATGTQRTLMAEGNLLLFSELAPHLNNFVETFGGHTEFDQQALDTFMAEFSDDEQNLAQGFQAYYQARFADDPKVKQELTLLGNYHLVTHEQSSIDPILDQVLTDLPWYADVGNALTGNEGSERANEAIVVEYPGRSSSVADDVPAFDPNEAAYDNLVLDFDNIDDERIQEFLLRYADDNNADPRNLENTDAKDWHEFSERMYYIYQDWREHHTDEGLFDMAAGNGLSDADFG